MRRILFAILLLPGLAYAQSAAQRLSQVGHVLNTGSPAASALGGSETMVCIQGGVTTACTPAQIKTYVGSGSGTVTSVSVVSANGLSGSVATATTTPAITLAPTFTGIAYSNGSGLAAAIAANFPTLNQSTTGNAATATAFAAAPTTCTSTQAATGILANGNATGCFTPSGSGTVTDGAGTTTANELLLSSTTAHAYTNAVTLPTSALPALAGDVTSSAGSNSVTVKGMNGATIPVSATVLGSNSSSQLVSASTTGSGSVALAASPSLTTPAVAGYATASLPTCNGTTNKGALAYTTDGTPALSFCNGTSWVSQGGTTFTIAATGCTPSAHAGSATAGTITLAAGPCTSIVITFNGAVGMTAPNGWHCNVGDRTLQNAGTWFGEWPESSSTTTTATIGIPSAAGSTDVISFDCQEF